MTVVKELNAISARRIVSPVSTSAKRLRSLGLLAASIAAVFATQAQAQTQTWNNAGTDWATAANWSTAVPTSTDAVFFNTLGTTTGTVINPALSADQAALSLAFSNTSTGGGWSLTGTNTLTLGGNITTAGSGIYTINGPLLAGAAATNPGFTIGTSSTLVLAGNTAVTGANQGLIGLTGGTLRLDNSGTNVPARLLSAATNTISINGGGTLQFVGNAAGTTTNLGNLVTTDNGLGGTNTIRVTPNGAATLLNFAATSTGSLRAGTRSIWDFQAASGNLGDATGARITFTTTPFVSSANGLFANTATGATVGFATVTDALGKNFATYNTVGTTAIGIVSIANPGQSVATVTTVTDSAGLAALTATSKGQFNAPTGTTTMSAAIPALTLRVSPASGATLALGTNNLAAVGIMLDGPNDYSITATTGVVGSGGTHYIYVNNPSTTLSLSGPFTSGTNATIFAGPGFVSLTGAGLQNNGTAANNYRVTIAGGVLRGNNTQLELGTATRGVICLYGGVLEITGGTNGTGATADFRRALGTVAGSVNWGAGAADTGSGGFSAFGAPASVNIGGASAALTWNQTNFVGNGYALRFGSTKSDNTLAFQNPLGLDGGTAGSYLIREVSVTGGTGVAADKTQFTGGVSGSASTDLLKTGTGTLELTIDNTYAGNTLVNGGRLLVSNSTGTGSATGTGNVFVNTGATLAGNGKISNGANRVYVNGGGTITPTNATGGSTTSGTLSTGAQVWAGGGKYQWDLTNTAGVAGTDWDLLQLGTNNLDLTSSSGTPFTIQINRSGAFPTGSFTIAHVGSVNTSIITAAALNAYFTTNASSFVLPDALGGGTWQLTAVDNSGIDIQLTATPEPGSLSLLGLGMMGLLRRRSRNRARTNSASLLA